jgi:hypothetical protein
MITLMNHSWHLKLVAGPMPTFPARATVTIILDPPQTFGIGSGPSKTHLEGVQPGFWGDATHGKIYLTSPTNFDRPVIRLRLIDAEMILNGDVFTFRIDVAEFQDLHMLVHSAMISVPIALNLYLGDCPTIRGIGVDIGATKLGFEYLKIHTNTYTKTQEQYTSDLMKGLETTLMFSENKHRNFLVALTYFYTACRLREVGSTPWEFTSAIIVNYAKILECLFVSGSTETIRQGLADIDVTKDEIERDFIPLCILRSKFDGAHASLSLLTEEDTSVIHEFMSYTEKIFRRLLIRVKERIDAGTFAIAEREWSLGTQSRKDMDRLIASLKTSIEQNKGIM